MSTGLDRTVEVHEDFEAMRDALTFSLDDTALAALRSGAVAPAPPLSELVERQEHVVSEDPEVTVRVHRRKGLTGAVPCVLSIHGGGYVIGSSAMDDPKLDRWCQELDLVGVSVEYRLAPETPYPGPLEDCYAALRWTFEHAAELGIDPDRIGITGVSAGGGLCAGLALLARDRAEVPVRFQLLDCPMLDDRQTTPSSQLEGLLVWTKASNTFGWRSYLGALHGSDDVPAYAAPARAADLTGLPEAYVCVGGADGFRDEDITYALRLSGAGVPTELHVYPGAPHGVAMLPHNELAQRYERDQRDWLARQLRRMAT